MNAKLIVGVGLMLVVAICLFSYNKSEKDKVTKAEKQQAAQRENARKGGDEARERKKELEQKELEKEESKRKQEKEENERRKEEKEKRKEADEKTRKGAEDRDCTDKLISLNDDLQRIEKRGGWLTDQTLNKVDANILINKANIILRKCPDFSNDISKFKSEIRLMTKK